MATSESEYRTCGVCSSRVPKDKCLRLTEWTEEEHEDAEWCCARCASKAMMLG